MNNNEEQPKKPNKKFAVGDLPPSPTTSTGTIPKRPTRHHVKRRSSGRVHVSKLAPMARAHSSTNIDPENNEEKKPTTMKRSQSNKSLNRLGLSERNKNNLTGLTPANKEEEVEKVVISPPTTPPLLISDKKPPTFPVSNTTPAAPIEQTLTVTADDILVTPDNKKRQLLKSQFIDHQPTTTTITQQPSEITSTQQNLLLQQHQENDMAHSKNKFQLTKEIERMGREYHFVPYFIFYFHDH
ncbi:uncharacterized protein BX663DRAFT_484574 [Cokeromyces recurvatus]|uniref:uncharacterized protein n=1 Tax=Cokeromyces recurvatus TaxID=90255 RepID=UPI00221E85DD|nr:uncharacterized protein BX663DRAFT_484574 [Cokeromyces recurvatus]KAI7905289.1 hypothetical protein BX663DRAFT_484574 [Cokeromyces recurvatus]